MNLDVFLSLFSLMLISLAIFLLSKELDSPHPVLLAVAGSLLLPISHIDFFSYFTRFRLTPELLLVGAIISKVIDAPNAIDKSMLSFWQKFHANSKHCMQTVVRQNAELLRRLYETTATQAFNTLQGESFGKLHKYEIIARKR